VSVVLALFVRTFLLQAYVVPTPSMEDNILVGDHLIVNKFLYAPAGGPLAPLLPRRPLRRGDVFVFKFPDDPRRDFVKRAIALPGDLVEIRDKVVYVNQAPLSEPRVTHSDRSVYAAGRRDQFGPIRVPEGQVFALGDNRDTSNDSRYWGTVPLANVKGRALFVYWSFPPERPGRSLRGRVEDFWTRTRWDRTFQPVR
jgi:signal peptidase I